MRLQLDEHVRIEPELGLSELDTEFHERRHTSVDVDSCHHSYDRSSEDVVEDSNQVEVGAADGFDVAGTDTEMGDVDQDDENLSDVIGIPMEGSQGAEYAQDAVQVLGVVEILDVVRV